MELRGTQILDTFAEAFDMRYVRLVITAHDDYWLQAAIYYKLVYEYIKLNKTSKSYEYLFKFVVIDKYNQVYVFDVSESTMHSWGQGLRATLDEVNVHYTRKDYSLPYKFLKPNKFIL